MLTVSVDDTCSKERHDFWQGLPIGDIISCALDHASGRGLGENVGVHVRITDAATMCEYNKAHRHRDTSTNILSFPVMALDQPWFRTPEGCVVLGDLLVCDDNVMHEAQSQHKTPAQHATHLLVHGLLHLLHYDHETDSQATVMEDLERIILAALGWSCPYGTEHG